MPTNPRFRMVITPDDDRRPAAVAAEIRFLEEEKFSLQKKGNPYYREQKKALNQKIYQLAKIGIPQDMSWRNNDGRPPFLPKDQITVTVRLAADQWAFCQKMSPKGNVSMGVRGCIDFTMAARDLPALPDGLED